MANESEFFTSEQTARLLGLKPQTMRAWRLRRRGPRYIRLSNGPTGRVLYARGDIERYLKERTFASTSEEHAKKDMQEAKP